MIMVMIIINQKSRSYLAMMVSASWMVLLYAVSFFSRSLTWRVEGKQLFYAQQNLFSFYVKLMEHNIDLLL